MQMEITLILLRRQKEVLDLKKNLKLLKKIMRAHNCKFKGQFNTSDLSKARSLLMHRETIISSKCHLELIIIINALFKDVRAQKFPRTDFFKLATQRGVLPKRQKKLGVTDFVLERTYPEKYPKSEKSGFLS